MIVVRFRKEMNQSMVYICDTVWVSTAGQGRKHAIAGFCLESVLNL